MPWMETSPWSNENGSFTITGWRCTRWPSPRQCTGTLPPVEYPGRFIVKRVTNAGTIRLKKRLLFFANALKQHPVGLEEVADGIWSIHFCRVLLGRSTNAITSSGRNTMCYPCCRFILLPMFPVAH